MSAPATHPRPRQCPTPAKMAEYIDGRTSQAETNQITAHVADCPPCVEWLAGSVRTIREVFAGKVQQ